MVPVITAMFAATSSFAGQGANRLLYTVPNSTFIENPTGGESVVTINDVSGSISTVQTAISNARNANPGAIIVIHLLSGATYTVSSAGLVLSSRECLVGTGATIRAAASSVTVPLIQIASGSTNVSIAGGTLDGSGANINGIMAPAAARVNIDRVTVQACGLDGILLKGNGNSTYDNEMSVTRCDASGSPAHAGISIQNSTQTICVDNNCHNNLAGIWISCAWATVANNTCQGNATGIDANGGNDNVIANNTCNNNAVGIHAGASNNMLVSNSLGGNSTAGITSNGSGNTFIDNLFTAGNASNYSSAGSGNRVVAYKTPLSAPGQSYFYPPLIDDQHPNPIVAGLGRTDLTIASTTIDAVQTQYEAARSANPNNVIVLHLPGTYTVGATALTLASNTCVLLSGTIQINSSTAASAAIKAASGSQKYISLSGGIIDGGNLTGNNGIQVSSASMLQVDAVTLRNFGPSNPRVGGSDVIHFDHGSTPYIVTRCTVNGGSARGIWLQLSGVKSLIAANDVSNCNQDGVDCDSSTSGSVVTFNNCHNLVRYGVFFEQSASHNVAVGNICNHTGRGINVYNNDTSRPPTQYNTAACNSCDANSNGLRNGSTGGGTNTVTSHNFFFNNVVTDSSGNGIESDATGTQNYYSQNYLSGNGTAITTSGSEAFFNSPDGDGSVPIQDSHSGLFVVVANASTGSGAAVVTGQPNGSDQWRLLPADNGYHRVMNQNSGLVLAVNGASLSAGAPIIQAAYSADTTYNDEWLVQPAGNGLYNFVNRRSGLYLDVTGASTNAGVQLTQQLPNGGANQQFNLGATSIAGQLSFFLSTAPATQTVLAGGGASYTVTVTPLFGSNVTVGLTVNGLPAGAAGGFSPMSVTGAGTSTLSVTTGTNTAVGVYPLTITGISDGVTNRNTVNLVVSSGTVAMPGTLVWTSASGTNANWSTTLNWTNVTAGGFGPPGASNDVVFTNIAATPGPDIVDNLMNSDAVIGSLTWNATNAFHTTQISAGATLVLTGTKGLVVGTESDLGNSVSVYASVTGAGGGLVISNGNANLIVRQGSTNSAGTLKATLDLSGLDIFQAVVSRVQLGSLGANPRPSGTLYLARTNTITAGGSAPAIQIGGQGGGSGNGGNGSFLYLGQTNAIFANGISVATVKQQNCSMLFNPSLTGNNPTAYFRAADGVSPVPTWFIADSQSQSGTVNTSGTNDFSDGTVDALVNTLTIARSSTGGGAGNPVGTLTFSAGTMTAGTLQIGYQGSSGANAPTAEVNVNGTATLAVTGALEMAHIMGGAGATNTVGTLNINGGTVLANVILNGGGIANVNVNAGTLALSNNMGTAARSISALNLAGATLRLQVDAGAAPTNIITTNLTASGITTVNLDSVANVTGTNRFPLIQYTTFAGSVAANFALGSLPAGFSGYLEDNGANQTIDVVIARLPVSRPTIRTIGFSGGSIVISGTNGSPGVSYSVLSSTNLALPLMNWNSLGADIFDGNGHFSFTIDINPGLPQQFYLIQSP